MWAELRDATTPACRPGEDEHDVVDLLRRAHRTVLAGSAVDDPLEQTALHLISCAAGMVEQLRERDLDAAREALGCARAAVVTATYAVQQIDSETRMQCVQTDGK